MVETTSTKCALEECEINDGAVNIDNQDWVPCSHCLEGQAEHIPVIHIDCIGKAGDTEEKTGLACFLLNSHWFCYDCVLSS